jgi:hypothetical protein
MDLQKRRPHLSDNKTPGATDRLVRIGCWVEIAGCSWERSVKSTSELLGGHRAKVGWQGILRFAQDDTGWFYFSVKCSCRNISALCIDKTEEMFLQEHCGKLCRPVLQFATIRFIYHFGLRFGVFYVNSPENYKNNL